MFGKILFSLTCLLLILGSHAHADKAEGLVLYFPFDEGAGDEAKDASGTGNDGDINGAKWADKGKYGGALEFDGKSYVEVPSSNSLEELVEEVTIAVWVNPELTGSGWQGIVTKGDDAAEHFELLVNVDGHAHTAQMFEQGRLIANRPAPGSIVAGEWQHLAVTYKPGEWVFYINGEVQESKIDATTNLVPDGKPVVIGDEIPKARFFEGLIDEVAIFNRALSEDEIKLIMDEIGNLLSVEPLGKIASKWAEIKK